MVDSWNVSQEKGLFYRERARTVIANLQKRKINAQYVPSRQEALSVVMGMVPEGVTVVRGDSLTLDQVGVIAELEKRNRNKIFDPYQEDASGAWTVGYEEGERMRREAFTSDIFLTSTNAVTLDGRLVNIDGHGNRVSAMIFGPKKVIIVAGVNKIVKDVDEALERIHHFAAPVNSIRHHLRHRLPGFDDMPCVRTGRCIDCNHDWRICNFTVIIDGVQIAQKGRINVVLIGEELGI